MLIALEKKLIEKDYIDLAHPKTIWSYCKKNNYLNQVNIEYLRDKEKFKFTFPLNSGDHYTAYIKDKNVLEKYVEFIISSHIQ